MSELTEYFLRHYTLVIDNEQASHERAASIAQDFIVGEEISYEDYETMSTREREDRFASAIGELILEWIDEEIEAAIVLERQSLGGRLINEIMAGGWSELEYALGSHYMPETGDMEGLLDSEDECEHETISARANPHNGADICADCGRELAYPLLPGEKPRAA